MWVHGVCGWTGTDSDIKLEYVDGIVVAASCPQCGGDWPFIFDDNMSPDVPDTEPEWTPTNRDQNLEARSKRRRMWS